ncbi:MAG: hypothetical protein ACRD9R_09420 [Pyrinomonadaceae bacterium]
MNEAGSACLEDSRIFNVNSTTFGQIPLGNIYPPRIMQFAARFEF